MKHNSFNSFSNAFIIFLFFSLIGWIYETILFIVWYGSFYDRGFLNIPILPIYGFTIVITKKLIGTVKKPSKILIPIKNDNLRFIAYISMCFLMPTIFELLTGFLFDYYLNLRLWNYSNIPLNINGYICLRYSLIWMVLLYVAIDKICPILADFSNKFHVWFKTFFSIFILVLILFDFIKTIS